MSALFSTIGKRNDDNGKYVGDNHVDRHCRYASAKLLGEHRSGGSCRADDADKDAFHDYLCLSVTGWYELNGEYYERGKEHTDALEGEVPLAWAEVVHVDLAESKIEHAENNVRHEVDKLRSHEVAHRLEYVNA